MDAIETRLEAVVLHGEVETELRALAVRQVTSLFGRTVWRVDLHHWRIDGSEPRRLLVAIDALMCRRSVLCYHATGASIRLGNRRQMKAEDLPCPADGR